MTFASISKLTLGVASLLTLAAANPGPVKPELLSGLVWRNVGPFRAGRVASVSGAIGEVGTFYIGLPAGGIWKTTSAGETWYPIFDAVKDVSSVGAIEVAPSNPNIVYAGTGDLITGGSINEGNGVYKTTDAGATWKHIGLDNTKQIPSIIVDPRNPDVVLVAAQGDVHNKSQDRGVYRSTDGGANWTRTLFAGDSIGIQKIAIAYDMPDVVYATTVRHYAPPPGPAVVPPARPFVPTVGTGTFMFKSIDGGVTWHEIIGGSFPPLNGRTSIAVAQTTNAQRVYLTSNTGFYRSDDGGTTWKQMDASDTRIRNGQGGYNCGVYVDPKNPDVVYVFNTASYKSTDGGNTFTGFKGAPGGDDPQQGWIDPTNGKRMLLGYDQGAIVTLDGGGTWSSWYNQSTEQVYHISADNSFPYYVYATQQDAGAVRTRSRGNLGAITPLDWSPVNGWEWGTVIADPLNPNIVYASGNGIVKISLPSEQWISVSPAANTEVRYRSTSSAPLAFAPWNQHQLLAGTQYVLSTLDAGAHWKKLSPDLGYPKGFTPPADTAAPVPGNPTGGSIETISASTVGRGIIWVGTSNGLIKVTRDEGKTWSDATIPGLPTPTLALMSIVEASHHDSAEAYVAIDIHRTGDYAPYIYRTKDFGKTWTKITNGLPSGQPSGSFARVVRADTKRKGLLFAGTESGMYVSFDDGDNWQSLQLNLPNSSYRDITIKGNDLVVGTYGRGIWILDDFAVLRQVNAAVGDEPAHLFKPDPAVRIRRNVGWNTPFPPEVPHALNAPDGAMIYYSLASKPTGDITLDIVDSAGALVRHMSSAAIKPVDEASHPPHPNFWVETPQSLPTDVGLNRVNWNVRYDDPPAFNHGFEINANPGLTPASPEGAVAAPGVYTAKLTVNGKTYSQTFTVTNDPRSPATTAEVRAQVAFVKKIQDGIKSAWDGYHQVDAMRTAVKELLSADSTSDAAKAVIAFRAQLDTVGGNAGGGRGFGGGGGGGGARRPPPPSFFSMHGRLVGQLTAQENADLAPTEAMLQGAAASCRDLLKAVTRWQTLNGKGLTTLNAELSKAGKKTLMPAALATPRC